MEHFFEWPCRWVSHQGLWSKTFYAGTLYLVQLTLRSLSKKVYKGNTPAFYNYFIGLLLFCVFLASESLHNLNISSKVSTAFKENLFRKWSSTPCLPPSLLWRPTTKWYKLYQTLPIYAKLCQTMKKQKIKPISPAWHCCPQDLAGQGAGGWKGMWWCGALHFKYSWAPIYIVQRLNHDKMIITSLNFLFSLLLDPRPPPPPISGSFKRRGGIGWRGGCWAF